MKICIINNLYPPYARGGAEQVVRETVEGLLSKGHEVVLVTTLPEENSFRDLNNLKIRPYKPWNFFFYTDAHQHMLIMRFLWHVVDMFHLGSARFVMRALQEEKPDVVHTHNLMGVGFLIPRVVRRLGIRHVHTVHDVQLVEPSGIILKTREHSWRYTGFPTKVYSWVMKKLIGSPDVVISPSQFLLDFYTSRGFFPQSQKVLVRNPLTLDFENLKFEIRNLKLGNRETLDTIKFIYLGQIEEHKGVFLLIQAFEGIENAELDIVGDGSQLEKVKQKSLNNKCIHYHGRVDRDRLPELFNRADVTIVPSLCYENSPTVIFESLYFGVPVLASRIEGIAELISEGENGFTFEAGNVTSLREKIGWCISHRDELYEMRKKISALQQPKEKYLDGLLQLYHV